MVLNDKKVYSAGVILLLIAIVGGLVAGENIDIEAQITNKAFDISNYLTADGEPAAIKEYANEAEPLELTHSISEANVCNVTFRLTWTDEENTGWIGSAPNHENQPDKFLLKISSPDASIHGEASGSNAIGKSGLIETTIPVPVGQDPAFNGTGDWNITVIVDAGDHMPRYAGIFKFNDVGNDFLLEITYQFYISRETL